MWHDDALKPPAIVEQVGVPFGEVLTEYVRTRYGRTLTLAEVRQVLRAYARGTAHPPLHAAGQVMDDLRPVVGQFVDEVGREIASFISRRWRDGERGAVAPDAQRVLLIGGGAHYFADHIRDLIPTVAVPTDPERANVSGYLALARQWAARLRGQAA